MTRNFRPSRMRMSTSPPLTGPSALLPRALLETTAVWYPGMEMVLDADPTPSPRHVPRAVAGTGGCRCRSITKFIEWWHQTKKTARESVNPFQRYKLLKSVTGSGWVGSGRAYCDFSLKPLKNSLRASRSARNNFEQGGIRKKSQYARPKIWIWIH